MHVVLSLMGNVDAWCYSFIENRRGMML